MVPLCGTLGLSELQATAMTRVDPHGAQRLAEPTARTTKQPLNPRDDIQLALASSDCGLTKSGSAIVGTPHACWPPNWRERKADHAISAS